MLVIHQGALGDFILALPALEILRKTFPQARSVIMGYPRILELVEHHFYAEEILSIDQQGMATFFVREGGLNTSLSRFFNEFDLIIVFGKDGRGDSDWKSEVSLSGTNSSHQSFPAMGPKGTPHGSSPQRAFRLRVFHFRDNAKTLSK